MYACAYYIYKNMYYISHCVQQQFVRQGFNIDMNVKQFEQVLKESYERKTPILRVDGTEFPVSFSEHGYKPFRKYADLKNKHYTEIDMREAILDYDGIMNMLSSFKPTTISNYVAHIRNALHMPSIINSFGSEDELQSTLEYWTKVFTEANAARYKSISKNNSHENECNGHDEHDVDTQENLVENSTHTEVYDMGHETTSDASGVHELNVRTEPQYFTQDHTNAFNCVFDHTQSTLSGLHSTINELRMQLSISQTREELLNNELHRVWGVVEKLLNVPKS